jgi:hypothetical protein
MKLISDEVKGMYYWVDDKDESVRLSPSFDYENDAIQWKYNIAIKVASMIAAE